MADFSAKDAARSKFRATQRHTPGRGAGRGRGAPVAAQPAPASPGDNSWRFEEESEGEGEPTDGLPAPRSQGADLAELLEAAASSSFFGRRSVRGAFERGWGDEAEAPWGRGLAPERLDERELGAMLSWNAGDVATLLSQLPLHQLLGCSAELAEHAAEGFERDTRAFLASSARGATRSEEPRTQEQQPQAMPRAELATAAPKLQTVAAVVPPVLIQHIIAPPAAPVPTGPDEEDEDDAFLNEMLGKRT